MRALSDLADFSVGDRLVRPSLSQIVSGEQTVHVEPRSIDVLIALAERAGEVCPKKELIEAVWGAAFVSDEVLTHAIWDLRRAFGDDASHPRFIQTIPKRGYRLIAPVAAEKPEAATARAPTLAWVVAAGALAVAALLAALAWWQPESESRRAPAERRLIVVSPEPGSAAPAIERRFYEDLLAELAGAKGLEVLADERCEQASAGSAPTLCLTLDFEATGESFEIQPRLDDARTGELTWAPNRSLTMTDSVAASKTAADEVKKLVQAYLRAIDMEFYADADIRPWFDFSRHDTRAIGDFLEGVRYVYTNQKGGRNPLDVAAARDPGFAAPRIWRIPTLVTEGDDPDKLAAYLEDLRRLYPSADPFERPLIQWALAVADGNVAKQLLELSIALEQEPQNRALRFMLGVTKLTSGDLEGAWQLLEPLADRQWRHPGLYSAAASCAIRLERLQEAQEFLDHAASRRPVDAETFELLELLALYRDDEAAAAGHRERKRTRIDQLDEPYLFDAAPLAAKLAEMASAQGRDEVARKLREFSD